MSTAEHVALWAGLISSIVSIVMSIIAIWFAVHVDRGARQVTAQTIKSLQKIESDVERLSTDTRELIKAGWDKMLGTVQALPAPGAPAAAKDIAAGIAAELRADLASLAPVGQQAGGAAAEPMNELLERLEKTLAAQIRTESVGERPAVVLEQARVILEALSPEARALGMAIARRHLTRKRYMALLEGPLARTVGELREAGVLVPVHGKDKDGHDVPVYYYPSRLAAAFRTVMNIVPAPSEAAQDLVKGELTRVGYYADV
jgi:hypothetical protein